MSTIWKINGTILQDLGVSDLRGEIMSHGPGSIAFDARRDFLLGDLFAYDSEIILSRVDGTSETVVFAGHCKTNPIEATDNSERVGIEVFDSWADLEETIYEESWSTFTGGGEPSGSTNLGISVLNSGPLNVPIKTGAMIAKIINFASGNGARIRMGVVPEGRVPLPSEADNMSCAAAVLKMLSYHPDWLSKMDYSTVGSHGVPTLNFYEKATLAGRSFPVDGSGDVEAFGITSREDLKPKSVIIKYITLGGVSVFPDPENSFKPIVDKWPPSGPDSGPGVISVTKKSTVTAAQQSSGSAPLLETRKQRVGTETFPTNQTEAKAWLKKKFPAVAEIDDAKYNVTGWERILMPLEIGGDPDEDISGLIATDENQLPRELVSGSIYSFMQRKFGKVRIVPKLQAASGVSDAEREKIEAPLGGVSVIGTNATSRVYSESTSYPAEIPEVPTPEGQVGAALGFAKAYYEALHQNSYEGQVTISAEDIPQTLHAGTINLTGGRPEWATMQALCNRISWNLESGRATYFFGPPRWWSLQDFIDIMSGPMGMGTGGMQTTELMDSGQLQGPGGSKIDYKNNGPLVSPLTEYDPPLQTPARHAFYVEELDGGGCKIHPGSLFWAASVTSFGFDHPDGGPISTSRTISAGSYEQKIETLGAITVSGSGTYGVELKTDKDGQLVSADLVAEPSGLKPHNPSSDPSAAPSEGHYFFPIAEIESGKVSKIYRRSDVYWTVHAWIGTGGTTIPVGP